MKRTSFLVWVGGCLTLLNLLLALPSTALGALLPKQLQCEYLDNPLGLDAPKPRLSWVLQAESKSARNQSQTAYQILVASTPGLLARDEGDLWNSEKVESSAQAQIAYGGKALKSGQRYFWKVRVWDQTSAMSPFSAPAFWEMGLLWPMDWQGRWIGQTADTNSLPAPMLRREFNLKSKILSARAYICGLGYHELYLNGKRIGDQILDPGYTRFDRRVLYLTHDVTADLKPGPNAVGVLLGNGWYNVQTKAVWNFHQAPWRAAPRLLFQLQVDYVDGRSEIISSDNTWKTSTGPIVFNSIYGGETYDARLEKTGWDQPGFNDSDWAPVALLSSPKGSLSAQAMPGIKIAQTLKPVSIKEPQPGVFIYDIGQNLAGMAQLTVSGPAGTKVQIRYGERLNADGTLDVKDISQHVKSMGSNQQHQTDTYILKGQGRETWHSRFTYHGFQYVEVTGFPGKPSLNNLSALFIHSDVPPAGTFTCSDPLINQVQKCALWAFLSNLQGVPTDCPHREKNGWTGDAHIAAEQAMFNFNPVTVHAKWINDIGDEQRPSGEIPGIVPTSGWGYSWGNGPAWDSAFLLIPYYQYLYYGDREILASHYAGMKRYVDYLTTKAKDGIVSIGLNDWAPYDTKTEAPITSTGYYYVDTKIVALTAELIGNKADAQKYNALAASIKQAFNTRFYKAATGSYDNGSQTALSCALYQGFVPDENRQKVLENLVAAVDKRNGHIDTGILGAKYILNTLTDMDRADVAYRMVTQKDMPGWFWWLSQGATTLWENWDGKESRNHIMYGDVSAWFYKAIAGINPDAAAPGFKHVIIKPHVLGNLTSARGEYQSIHGTIISEWKLTGKQFRLNLVIPPNVTAEVSLPIADANTVEEGGKPLTRVAGIKMLSSASGRSVCEVGSGTYVFTGPVAN